MSMVKVFCKGQQPGASARDVTCISNAITSPWTHDVEACLMEKLFLEDA